MSGGEHDGGKDAVFGRRSRAGQGARLRVPGAGRRAVLRAAALRRAVPVRNGDRPEYLWERSPSNAVLRRRDNRKWYAAFLTVAADKLGLPRTDVVEIVDLRMRPQELGARADGVKYFRGWHMNKKSWVTALLDGTVPVGELRNLLDESYRLAGEK